MRYLRYIALAVCLLSLQSCKNSFAIFSGKYPVRYRCDVSVPPYNTATSLGVFLSVRQSGASLVVTDNDGVESRYPMTQMESKDFILGLGGLILGTPALDNPDCVIYAYDLACPVCERASTRVTFSNTGEARCPSCHTVFDLNNNGFVIASDRDDTRPLFRYPVSRMGMQVIVSN